MVGQKNGTERCTCSQSRSNHLQTTIIMAMAISGGDNEGDGTRTGIRIENLMTHDYMSFP